MTVTGRPELVDEAIDHLLNLEEEYVSYSARASVLVFGGGGGGESGVGGGAEITLALLFHQLADVVENEAKMAYMRPPGGSAATSDEQRGQSNKGFVVREAPWATSEKVSRV